MPENLQEAMDDLVGIGNTAVFLASSRLFSRKVLYGKWLLAQKYSSHIALEKDLKKIFKNEKWRILDTRNFPGDLGGRINARRLYEVLKLSEKYDSEPVRAFQFLFKRIPTIKDFEKYFQGVFDNEIEFVYQHLRNSGALKKLSSKERQGVHWKKYLHKRRGELIPYQFVSLSIYVNEVVIFLREGLGNGSG
ncbi:MAG: hypothetical protein JNJ47_06695 [Alphaproteobacteria bacterium]|nr:hypothetical protein [Alphaproteobacteria bacterium]